MLERLYSGVQEVVIPETGSKLSGSLYGGILTLSKWIPDSGGSVEGRIRVASGEFLDPKNGNRQPRSHLSGIL